MDNAEGALNQPGTGSRGFSWPSVQVAQSLVDRLPIPANPRMAVENAIVRGLFNSAGPPVTPPRRPALVRTMGGSSSGPQHSHSHLPGQTCPHHGQNLEGLQHRRMTPDTLLQSTSSGEHTAVDVDEGETEEEETNSLEHSLGAGHFNESSNISNGQASNATQSPPANATAAAANALGGPIIKYMQSFLPFLLLLLMKVLYNHRLGILVFVGLILAFQHGNTRVARKVMTRVFKQDNLRWRDTNGPVVWTIVFLSGCIFAIYYFFAEEELYNVFYFSVPAVERIDLWTLVWVVCITDFVIKYATVILKALISLLPESLVRYRRKGAYYMLVEGLSLFYRSLVPIVPWINFLLDDQHGGPWFSATLVVIYAICKAYQLYFKTCELKKSILHCRQQMSYGVTPTKEKVQMSESCPICHDEFREPVMLSCEHVFCEDCVNIWFMNEKTCPMCRSIIRQTLDIPTGRDGVTSSMLLLF